MKGYVMQYNRQYKDIYKIAHTILFFIENDMHHFGITKLMKLFFYADKYHLEKYKKTIFNQEYTKLKHGPVPESIHALLLDTLSLKLDNGYPLEYEEEAKVISNFIDINTEQLDDKKKMHKLQSRENKQANKDFFSESELEILEKVSKEFKNMNTNDISSLSHETRAWKSVDMREPISIYNLVDNLEDRKFINYLYEEQFSFRNNFDIHKIGN